MSRLAIPAHPGRVFKSCPWGDDSMSGYGWRSVADHSGEPVRYGELEAFAVVIDAEDKPAQRLLCEEIVNLQPPFVAAELVRLGGELVAIGFYPPPN